MPRHILFFFLLVHMKIKRHIINKIYTWLYFKRAGSSQSNNRNSSRKARVRNCRHI